MAEPRTTAQRKADVLEKLRMRPGVQKDAWVASASADGHAYLVPLSYYWDGSRLTVATPANSATARNLRRAGTARLAIGPTRDVVMIDGTLECIAENAADELAVAHAAAAGFDVRRSRQEFVFLRLTPSRIQAWREANELAGRDVMVDGRWLV